MASDTNQQTFSLPHSLSRAVEKSLDEWTAETKVERLWARDASLWTDSDESKWLGWLDIVDAQRRNAKDFEEFAREIRSTGFTQALLLGMGGSSLCPEVLRLSFGKT